jgi:hypothetical protein
MTRDDIIRLAQQTGWDFGYEMCVEHVCEFAALVAAAEREACALIADSYEPRCDICPSGVSTAIRARGKRETQE